MAAQVEQKSRAERMKLAVQRLEKQFGRGVLMNVGGIADALNLRSISTGVPGVDYVTGIGGLPVGKHVEIYGRESAGKTTLLIHTIAQLQKNPTHPERNGAVLLLDFENTFDLNYAASLGMDTDSDRFIIAQPGTGEEGLEIMREHICSELVDMVVIDSTAAMLPNAEDADPDTKNNAAMGKAKVGSQSTMVSQGLKQISTDMNHKGVTCAWINQIRTKINTTGGRTTEGTTGGNALQFYIAMKLELRKIGSEEGKIFDPFEGKMVDGVTGIKAIVKCGKNKCAVPFKEAPLMMRPGMGFDSVYTVVEYCVRQGLLKKTAQGWYETKPVGASRQARGMADLRKLFAEEPQVYAGLLKHCDWNKQVRELKAQIHVVEREPEAETDPAIDKLLSTEAETPSADDGPRESEGGDASDFVSSFDET